MPSFQLRARPLLALLAIGMVGAGCSPIDQAKQQASGNIIGSVTNKALDTVTGGRVGLETKDGQVTFTDKGSGANYIVGEKIVIPADFPKEMLVYPDSKVLAVTTGAEATLNLKANETSDIVAVWYAEKLKVMGWKETSKYAAGGYESRSYMKDKVTLSFTFLGSRENDSKSTVVSISRKTEK